MRKTVSFWQEDICELLTDSIRFKSGVVALDPYDQGPRQMLNFGHSIGHGLEGLPVCADAKELLHGEAVAVGLICESFLAVESGLMARSVLQEITEVIRIVFELSPLDPEYDEEILQKITQDKKNESDKIIFSLAEKPGKPVLNVSVELHDIQKSFHYYNSLFVK
jgi:3-dehydroquinate synthase